MSRSALMLVPLECADEETAILAKLGRGESVAPSETVRIRKDGQRANVSVAFSALRDSSGRVVGVVDVLRDISERKHAEQTSRASEERIAALEQHSWDAVHLLSADGVILYESSSVIRVLGYRPDELVGRNSFELIHPDDVARVAELFGPLTTTPGLTLTAEVRVQHKDGSWPWMDCIATNLLEHPAVLAIAVNYRDITARKRTEEARRASEERLNFALETSHIGAWDLCLLDNTVNRTAIHDRIFGYDQPLPAWTYELFLEHVLPEDRGEVDRSFREATAAQANWRFECRIRRADGEVRWIWAAGGQERDLAGNTTRMSGFVQDITESKQTEQALRESEEYFRFLNDLSEATRKLTDPAHIMAVAARMLGQHLHVSRCAYADVEQDGQRFSILHDYTDGCASTVGSYDLSLFGSRAVTTLHGGETLIIRDVEAELAPQDGADMFNAIGIKAIIVCPLSKEGVLRAMMAVHQTTPRAWKAREISVVQDVVERCWSTIERRTAEEKLHQLNIELEQRVGERTSELEEANRELEAFSYSVSYDLRAPLRTLDGFSQALVEDYRPQLPEEAQRYLKLIRAGAQQMGALIDDLLAFAHLSRQSLTKRTVDTDSMVRAALTELEASERGREIEIRLGELPPCEGDPALLKQVWFNLLSNAWKYTRKCRPAIVEAGCERGSGANIYFVRDNGAGFDMKYVHKLFNVFQRLHRAEDYEGTGVGLAIVQRVIQRHGGRIWAVAAEGHGATFHFTLEPENQS